MTAIIRPVPKVDADALLRGAPVYTEDLAPANCLYIAIVRSPWPFAKIVHIDKTTALRAEGVACVLTEEDLPQGRYSASGKLYSFSSPNDRRILDQYVRFIGDAAAIVAADTRENAIRAAKLVRVSYERLEPVLDMDGAEFGPSVHPELNVGQGAVASQEMPPNVVGRFSDVSTGESVEEVFKKCDCVFERTFHTRQNAQAMMETFRSFSHYDANGKLTIVTSTQIPFICQRTVAAALGLPISMVRVIKPKVGGGFGAKQAVVSELYCAAVTFVTRRPAIMVFSRKETFTASNSRHEMKITVRMGAASDGTIRALSMRTRCNAGAYAEHACATALLTGHKNIGLYGKLEAYAFTYEAVYTNTMPGGAFRGYGATQGCFAVESVANEIAERLHMDPTELRFRNLPELGKPIHAYFGETLSSTALDRCIKAGKERIGWDQKYPSRRVDWNHIRSVGMAIGMQGSGITAGEKYGASVRMDSEGKYIIANGAGEMGNGCDTILAQIAAERLCCPMEDVFCAGVDTDTSPYDKGSYASSTTYCTGMAMVKACDRLIEKLLAEGEKKLEIPRERLLFDGTRVYDPASSAGVTRYELAREQVTNRGAGCLCAEESYCSQSSPPPFMAGFAETETDTDTGETRIIQFVGVIDCGTVINTNLARVQAEGGIVQGIGMALFEEPRYGANGRVETNSFLQYRIPTRLDTGTVIVDFQSSYEPTGPFGAKSIGEVVINPVAPAIADAVYHACGKRFACLPIRAEDIWKALTQKNNSEK